MSERVTRMVQRDRHHPECDHLVAGE
ncbi:hypothetical protein [Enterobacter hormaechei]